MESGYKKYLPNKVIYDLAIVRIFNNFVTNLYRKYFQRTSKTFGNSLIFPLTYPDSSCIISTLESGFTPLKAFIYLDANGYIQDRNNIPIIYDMPRYGKDKRIIYPNNMDTKFRNFLEI